MILLYICIEIGLGFLVVGMVLYILGIILLADRAFLVLGNVIEASHYLILITFIDVLSSWIIPLDRNKKHPQIFPKEKQINGNIVFLFGLSGHARAFRLDWTRPTNIRILSIV